MNRNLGLLCLASLMLMACASASVVDVPDTLKAGANESLFMVVPAKGVQIYECRAKKEASAGFEWVFVAPEAELFDARGKSMGRHGAGPYWQANDGSRIVATLKQRADAPVSGAIPWLLLTAKSNGPEGSFSNVTSIQRVNTVGGIAPATSCGRDSAGATERISYTADYYFFINR